MENKTDLVLVNPGARSGTYGKLGPSLAGVEPPLWCGLLASFVRQKGYTVKIIDADAENLSPDETAGRVFEENPLLVNIVVMGTNPSASSTPKMVITRQLITDIKDRKQDVKIVLSGIHPSALPEKTLNEERADFISCGEGFYTAVDLLGTLKKSPSNPERVRGLFYREGGRIVSNPSAPLIDNPDDLPFVAWDLLPMEKYRAHNWHCFENIEHRSPYAAIYTSFGCPYKCGYCNIHAMYNDEAGIRYRSPEKVVEEIGVLVERYNVKNLKIADELFVLNKKRVEKICGLIVDRKYNLNMWAYARIDTVDERILRKLKKAGVNWLCYGIESASEKVREGVSKKIRQSKIEDVIRMTEDAGIYILGNFIFGLPDDDMETMNETLELAERLNCEYVNFYTAMAYPGSALYRDSVTRGIKLPDRWDGYAQLSKETLPLPTKYLSGEEVLRFRDEAFTRYFNRPEYLDMIGNRFGSKIVQHIKEMMKNSIERKYVSK